MKGPKNGKAAPEVAVVGIIMNGAGQVLLTRRSREPMAGYWHLPGGGLKFGETFREGLARELREELGVDVELDGDKPVAICQTVYANFGRHVVALYFRAKIVGRKRPRCLDATDGIAWMNEPLAKTLAEKDVLLDSCRRALNHALGWALRPSAR